MTEWINADERLPEDENPVLCWYQNECGGYSYVIGTYIRWVQPHWETAIDNNEEYYQVAKITHWMQLPEPPHIP